MVVRVDDGRAAGDPLLARARELAGRVRERADEIEEQRRLPPDLVEELRDASLFTFLSPLAEGANADPVLGSRVVEEISAADGSAGWCIMIAAQGNSLGGYLPPEEARTIWSDRQIVAGTARPIGRAVWTSDPAEGYLVSCRWPFASGSSHADWLAGECIVYDGEQERLDANGNAVTRTIFVPRSDVTFHDTWHTTGLRGTASNDFSVESAFVPAARGFQLLVDPPQSSSPLYRALPLVFMNHGAQALGVARAALAAAAKIASERAGYGGVPLAAVPRIQYTLAAATAEVEAARAYYYDVAEQLWHEAQRTTDDAALEALAPLRARVRLATSHAAQASLRATDAVYAALATASIFQDSPLERPFRDIHTAGAHVMIGPLTFEAAGRVLLERDPEFPFF